MTVAASVEGRSPHASFPGETSGAMLGDNAGGLGRSPFEIVNKERAEFLALDRDDDDFLALDNIIWNRSNERHTQSVHASSPRFNSTERFDRQLHRLGFGKPLTALTVDNHNDFRPTVVGSAA